MNNGNFCLGCMSPKGGEQECRKCGYVEGTPQVLPCLAPGTILANRYLIGRHLRITGEGVTYIAFDRNSGRRVDIREYLPKKICTRRSGNDSVIVRDNAKAVYSDYLSDFIDVAKALSRLGDVPAIVPLINVFECNNTAYAVYEHVEGKPLSELVRRANRLTWEEAAPLFSPLVGAMASAHAAGLVHFSISPESIYMLHSGRLVLTDFGVPDARIAETEMEAQLYDGFAAVEQYSLEPRKGKWTDVYSMSAVILYALTGKRPPDALTRVRDSRLNVSSDLAESIPAHVVSALARGLQVHAENRTSSMDELRSELFSAGRSGARVESHREPPVQVPPQRPAEPRGESASDARSAASEFGSKVMGSVRDFGGKIGGFISDRRQQRDDRAEEQTGADGTPWYMNLSQWQYALLSTCLTIVVLGVIAVSVFLSVRSEISGKRDDDRTLEIVYLESDSDLPSVTAPPIKVPNLVGTEWSPALEDKYINDFQFLFSARKYSDDYPAGTIMQQSIAPDSEVLPYTPIVLTISRGSMMCKVPDIIGKTVSQAHTALENAGLLMGPQTEEYSDIYPAGTVIRLSYTSVGASMERNSMVSMVISLGPEG